VHVPRCKLLLAPPPLQLWSKLESLASGATPSEFGGINEDMYYRSFVRVRGEHTQTSSSALPSQNGLAVDRRATATPG
jgi:hypothetical protein